MSLHCLFGRHADEELILERRGPAHQIQWRCPRCMRVIALTEVRPKASLLRRLKVNANRALLRLVKSA